MISHFKTTNESFLIWRNATEESETATASFYQGILALLLRAGLVFIQTGSIPTDSVPVMLMQNVLDIFVTSASFGLPGFMVAYGKTSFWGVLGYGSWISSEGAVLNEAVRGKK